MEFTPLAHAARNGMTDMVDLMINSGANVNYLCSVRKNIYSLCVTQVNSIHFLCIYLLLYTLNISYYI